MLSARSGWSSTQKMMPVLAVSQTPLQQSIQRYGAVSDITQDPLGYFWIATRNGLLKYNGYEIRRFSHQVNSDVTMSTNAVYRLLSGDPEALWFMTLDMHLHRLDYLTEEIMHYDLSQAFSDEEFSVLKVSMTEDKIWLLGTSTLRYFSTQDRQLHEASLTLPGRLMHTAPVDNTLYLALDNGELYRYNKQELELLFDTGVKNSIDALFANQRYLVVAQSDRLWVYDLQQAQLLSVVDLQRLGPGKSVHAMQIVGESTLWLAGIGFGIAEYQINTGTFIHYGPTPGVPDSLQDFFTSALYLDDLQNLWVGNVSFGIFRIPLRHRQVDKFVFSDNGRPTPQSMRLLLVNDDGTVLFNDGKQKLWQWSDKGAHTLRDTGLDNVQKVQPLPNGEFIIVRNDKVGLADPQLNVKEWHTLEALQGKRFININDMLFDKNHSRIWLVSAYGLIEITLGSWQQTFHPLTPMQGRLSNIARIQQSSDGAIWLATQKEGLLRFNVETKHWSAFRDSPLPANGLLDMKIDSDDRIWLATHSGSMGFTYQQGSLISASPLLGAHAQSSEITSLLINGNDELWLTSALGLFVYDMKSWEYKLFSTASGISDTIKPKQMMASDNAIYAMTSHGINRISPQIRQNWQAAAFRFFAGELQNASNKYNLMSGKLPPIAFDKRQLRLSLLANSSDDLTKLLFQYSLDDRADEWSLPTESNQLDLLGLEPGKYNVRIRAYSLDNAENYEQQALSLHILAPWWKSTTAYISYLILMLVVISLVFYEWWQKKRARDAWLASLQEKEQQLSLALWGTGDELWDWQLNKNSLSRRNALEEFPHLSEQSSLDERCQHIHPTDQVNMQAALQSHLHGNTKYYQASYRLRTQNDEWLWVLDRGKVTQRDENGQALRMVGTLQVIHKLKTAELSLKQLNENLESLIQERTTELASANGRLQTTIEELKHTQRELVEVEKMASLGSLVAGLAHEINTPLGIVITSISSVEHLIKTLQDMRKQKTLSALEFDKVNQRVLQGCVMATENLNRINRLVESFKRLAVNFADKDLQPVHLASLLTTIQSARHSQLTEGGFKLELDVPDNLHILSYPAVLQDILLELINNSLRHAKTSCDAVIRIRVSYSNGECQWCYSDSGEPIAQALSDSMFEPFVTEARRHGNAGLGLNLVFNLITQTLKGRIRYEVTGNTGQFVMAWPCDTFDEAKVVNTSGKFPSA